MKKIIKPAPLDEAIENLDKAITHLDEMIKTMQDSQATLRSWLTDTKEIGWVDGKDD